MLRAVLDKGSSPMVLGDPAQRWIEVVWPVETYTGLVPGVNIFVCR
jgi:hypothetical protein